MAYYIVTKGEHLFGEERFRLYNLLDDKPVGLDKLHDLVLKDFISWMLSHDPNDRSSAKEAQRHPYLQPEKQQFEMLCKIGNQQDLKSGNNTSNIVRQLNNDTKDWRIYLNADVMNYLL